MVQNLFSAYENLASSCQAILKNMRVKWALSIRFDKIVAFRPSRRSLVVACIGGIEGVCSWFSLARRSFWLAVSFVVQIEPVAKDGQGVAFSPLLP